VKFERLFLRAFGPFTDLELDLSGGSPGGLHVIYGPNEAGKSTSLRAVKALLFGMPHRSVDAHLHPSNKLSVGAELSEGKRRVELYRLKRRKDDLVDENGVPFSKDPIPALLGNLDEASFASRFGLDQVELERGAEALLGGSEEGLFAAGTAGAEARKVLDALDGEAAELFLPRGKVPRLNRAAAAFESAVRAVKQGERPPEKWLEQERAYRAAKQRVVSLRNERKAVRAELRSLQRIRSLMSDLASWTDVDGRRKELGDVPALSEDAPERRRGAERALQEAEVESRRIREELRMFEEELARLPSESSLIEVEDRQLDLSTRVGTARSARKDMPKREASLLEHNRQLATLLRDLGRDAARGDELEVARQSLVSAQTAAQVQRLLTRHGSLVAEAQAAEEAWKRLNSERDELEGAEHRVEDPSFIENLSVALSGAQECAGLATSLEQDEERCEFLKSETHLLRVSLGVTLSWQDLAEALPPLEAILASIRRSREFGARVEQLRAELGRKQSDVVTAETRLARMNAGDVPTEARLSEARSARDEQLKGLEKAPKAAGFASLKGAIVGADDLADRLRREADRVAEVAAAEREISQLRTASERAELELEAATDKWNQGSTKFRAWVEKIGAKEPPPLAEAEAWFGRVQQLQTKEQELAALLTVVSKKSAKVEAAARSLLRCVGDSSVGSLNSAISLGQGRLRVAEQAVQRASQQQTRLGKLERGLREAIEAREKSARALREWNAKWALAVSPLGLPEDATIERAQEALTALDKVSRLVDGASNLEGRIFGMQRDTESLAEDVRQVAERHMPSLLGLDPVDAAVQLQEAINAARRTAEERTRLRSLIENRRANLSEVESRAESSTSILAELMREARVERRELLPEVEEHAREMRALSAKKARLEQALRDGSEGATVQELLEEAAPWKSGGGRLVAKIDESNEREDELEDELRGAESDAEGTRLGLETYNSEDVMLARQNASTRGAEARSALREYLVLRAAHSLLRGQVESYAERFRGPIAGRAGELFERLTLGRYKGLSVGVGDKTIRCVQERQELDVNQLSRGTRAQLYFALRLASLEQYFADQPAIPLVFDDLFVEFDDDRATVAFEILSELAQKVQVLYFTHLARDVEAAHNAVHSDLLFTHSIGVA